MPIFDIAKTEEGEEGSKSLRHQLKDPFIICLLIGLLMFLLTGRLGQVIWDKAAIGGFALILIGVFIKMGNAYFKYLSPAIIWINGKASYTGHTQPIGNYHIARLGGISTFIGKMEGNEGTIIFPISAINPVGDNMAITVVAKSIPAGEFPVGIYEYLKKNKLPTPYFWGVCNESQMMRKMKNPDKLSEMNYADVETLWEELRLANRTINQLSEHMRGKNIIAEEAIESAKRSHEAATRPPKQKRFGFRKTKEEDEE